MPSSCPEQGAARLALGAELLGSTPPAVPFDVTAEQVARDNERHAIDVVTDIMWPAPGTVGAQCDNPVHGSPSWRTWTRCRMKNATTRERGQRIADVVAFAFDDDDESHRSGEPVSPGGGYRGGGVP